MSITIRKQLAPFWLKLDTADSASAEFHLRPLNQLQFHGARDQIGKNDFDRVCITQSGMNHVLQHGLIDWRNVLGEDGASLPFTRDNYENLPVDTLNRLAWEILAASKLSDDQKKS
jgi:hypothetical protein